MRFPDLLQLFGAARRRPCSRLRESGRHSAASSPTEARSCELEHPLRFSSLRIGQAEVFEQHSAPPRSELFEHLRGRCHSGRPGTVGRRPSGSWARVPQCAKSGAFLRAYAISCERDLGFVQCDDKNLGVAARPACAGYAARVGSPRNALKPKRRHKRRLVSGLLVPRTTVRKSAGLQRAGADLAEPSDTGE